MAERIPAAPPGLGTAGKRLWRAVLEPFELDDHELELLRQAAYVADMCARLQEVVAKEGPLVDGKDGQRAHPGLTELRQQRILLTRLIVSLRVPLGDQETPSKTTPTPRRQHRGTRGAYKLKGVA